MPAVAPEVRVEVPYRPRPLQREVGMIARRCRFVVLVCHRRFGKTVLGVNLNQQTALTCTRERPRSIFVGPTYTQAKATAWDYMQHYAKCVPGQVTNQSELRIDFPRDGHGRTRIFGADKPDSLRGLYADRATLDEFGLHPAKTFTEVVGPMLVDRGGSLLVLGTPNGKNQFYDIAQHAIKQMKAGDPEWHYAEYKASDTGLLDEQYLAQARLLMTEDEYEQEFECSFTASVKGAIYAKELAAVHATGRVRAVPADPALPVQTAWDLGVGDATAIWLFQVSPGGEVRIVNYFEDSGEGMPHYVGKLNELRQAHGYVYGTHWAPHDIMVREFADGRSRFETAKAHGFLFTVAPKVGLEDGINAARMLLPRCYFDEGDAVGKGLEALGNYRRDYNQRLNEFKAVPVHDWAEHGASAFRYLAVSLKTPKVARSAPRVVTPQNWTWT